MDAGAAKPTRRQADLLTKSTRTLTCNTQLNTGHTPTNTNTRTYLLTSKSILYQSDSYRHLIHAQCSGVALSQLRGRLNVNAARSISCKICGQMQSPGNRPARNFSPTESGPRRAQRPTPKQLVAARKSLHQGIETV